MPDDARRNTAGDGGELMGDEVYQPSDDGGDGVVYTGDLENALDEPDYDDVLDTSYSPPEKPRAVEGYGTTAREQREGEPLDRALAEEVPDVVPPDGDGIGDQPGAWGEPEDEILGGEERAGRLALPDELTPGRSNLTARDVGVNGGAASAEEAAMHRMEPGEPGEPGEGEETE